MIQRDEFLDYYIKSQTLGMALLKDRSRIVEGEAWSRWFDKARALQKDELKKNLRDAYYLKANLEARESNLTDRNKELKTENASLAGMTTDQAVVIKNKNQL